MLERRTRGTGVVSVPRCWDYFLCARLLRRGSAALTSFRYAHPPRRPTHGGKVLPALWREVTPYWSTYVPLHGTRWPVLNVLFGPLGLGWSMGYS